MSDLKKRLLGKYSCGPDGVREDRDFGSYTPAINKEAVARIEELEEMVTAPKTNQEVVDETLELARSFYLLLNYEAEEGFKFYESQHPMELAMWDMACLAQDILRCTPVQDCLDEL